MADHSGNLAQVEDGKSLLPEIVRKELELEQQLAKAEATASNLLKEAQRARDEAIEKARAASPETEKAYLEEQVKSFDGEIETLRSTETARLDELRSAATPRIGAAAEAFVALVLESKN